MYTDVIIGFDGSSSGRDALALGRRIALATGAATTVVYVYPYQALTADVEADAAVELSRRLGAEHVLDGARAQLDDTPEVSFRAKPETSTARALHEIAMEAAAAVIVVGSSDRRGVGRMLPGATAEQVIHAAPCAVAVAPAGYALQPPRRVVGVVGVAVDDSPETERIARLAGGIARGMRAELRVLTVAETHSATGLLSAARPASSSMRAAVHSTAERALERATVAAGAAVSVERRLLEGPAGVRLIAESNDLDLLVIGSRGHGPLRRLALGSVTAAVLRGAACPVLAVPRCVPEELDPSIARIARIAAR